MKSDRHGHSLNSCWHFHTVTAFIYMRTEPDTEMEKENKGTSQKTDSGHYLLWKMTHQSSRLPTVIIASVCSSHKSFHQHLPVSLIELFLVCFLFLLCSLIFRFFFFCQCLISPCFSSFQSMPSEDGLVARHACTTCCSRGARELFSFQH